MLRRLSERMLRLLQGMWICHMLAWMVMVMVMVMVDGGWGAVAKRSGVLVGVGSDAASGGTPRSGGRGDGDGVDGGGGPQKTGIAGARGLGLEASVIGVRPAPHTPANPPPAPSGVPALRVLELSEIIL